MKRITKIGMWGITLMMLSACGNGTPDYDATGTFEATEVIVSAEAAGKLLRLEVEEGTKLEAGEEIGLVDTVQLYLKKLQLEASMKSVENQRPDLAKQIAATKQQIVTAQMCGIGPFIPHKDGWKTCLLQLRPIKNNWMIGTRKSNYSNDSSLHRNHRCVIVRIALQNKAIRLLYR